VTTEFQRRIDRIKEAVDMETVILEAGGTVQPSYGDWAKCICPFHDDRVASASVNIVAGAFTCHACGVKGDVIDVAKLYLELTEGGDHLFSRAMSWLEELGGIE
jgi:DNA primase